MNATDKLKADIAEYRLLRGISQRFRGYDVFQPSTMERLEELNRSTWPHRNDELKAYNDSLIEDE